MGATFVKRELNEFIAEYGGKAIPAMLIIEWKLKEGVRYIKARFVAKGFAELGKSDMFTRAPTATKLGQRMICVVAVLWGYRQISLDISAAFLRGVELERARTKAGAQRRIWCKPPSDVWDLLRGLEEDTGGPGGGAGVLQAVPERGGGPD